MKIGKKQTPAQINKIITSIIKKLDEMKADEILDINAFHPLSSRFVICTGSSSRHVIGMANNLSQFIKQELNMKTTKDMSEDWCAIATDIFVVHIMKSNIRKEYDLETFLTSKTKDESLESDINSGFPIDVVPVVKTSK